MTYEETPSWASRCNDDDDDDNDDGDDDDNDDDNDSDIDDYDDNDAVIVCSRFGQRPEAIRPKLGFKFFPKIRKICRGFSQELFKYF